MIEIVKPHITDGSEKEMLMQIRSYLYQMSEQLQTAFIALQGGGQGSSNYFSTASNSVVFSSDKKNGEKSSWEKFNELKSLIINSADVVNSYSEKIDKILNGKYFADSDFGKFVKDTQFSINANSEGILLQQKTVEGISNAVANLEEYSKTFSGYVYVGKMQDEGADSIGVEIGRDVEGKNTMRSRFTSQRLVFLDAQGEVLGYFKGKFLYLGGDLQVNGNVRMRRYTLDSSHGLSLKFNG